MTRVRLTAERVDGRRKAEKAGFLWDSDVPGFGVRFQPSGHAAYVVQYRIGGQRGAQQRRDRLGTTDQLTLKDARSAARKLLGRVADGMDPVAERREQAKRSVTLQSALADYEAVLRNRQVVNARWYISTLQRHLLDPLGPKVALADLTRVDLVGLIERLDRAGRPGAAQELRQRMGAFLQWAVDSGRLSASPLAGWRRPRATRAERLATPGRALEDHEIFHVWRACDEIGAPFGPFVQMLIACGQRRTETARMRWTDLDLASSIWTIPAAAAKTGRTHRVHLPDLICNILRRQLRIVANEHVFAGRGQSAMSNYSRRTASLIERAGVEAFTLHDLRRTFRSGLSKLGVAFDVAELAINHRREELTERYDRSDFWSERVEAANRWATHLRGLLAERDNITCLPRVPGPG